MGFQLTLGRTAASRPGGRALALRMFIFGMMFATPVLSVAQEQPAINSANEAFADANSDGVPDRMGEVLTISGVLTSAPVPLRGKAALVNMQDGTGGALLFARNEELLLRKVQHGDLVVATGEVSVYRGSPQLVLSQIRALGRGVMPEPKELRVSDFTQRRFLGELVRLKGALLVGADFLSNRQAVQLRDPTGQINVLISDRFFTSPTFLERFRQGGGIELTGIASQTMDANERANYQIIPRDADDFHFSRILPYREILIVSGFVVLLSVVGIAVQRRRRADKRVREVSSQAKHLAEERDRFFTLSLDMLCIAHRDGFFKRLNPAFAHTLGWSMEDFLARPFIDFVHVDDRTRTAQALADLDAGGEINCFENRYQCKDGSWRILSWKAVPQPDGTIFATARDITDHREAEDALRRLNRELEHRVDVRTSEVREALATLDATDDGAFIFDPETLRFDYVNEGAVRQLGHTRGDLLKLTPVQVMTEFDEARFRTLLAPMIRGEKRSQPLTTFHRHRDGREIPVEMNLQYVALPGERARFISIVRDITERRQAERIAQRSQRLESLGTLAGGVAHDLNNALTPILMGVETLKSKCHSDPGLITSFETSARRAADMVRQLLTFARGADGHHTPLQASRLIKEIQQIVAYTFPKNIRLEVVEVENLPSVRGDITQLHQVLLNLCVNARDAMPEGGTLTLEARAVKVDTASCNALSEAKPGRYVMMRVSDTGTGIPPDILEKIFDPFFTTKGPNQGTGLGLSTVVGIMRGHGGFLQVYSQVGRGSTFNAFLPVDASASCAIEPRDGEDGFRGSSESILVVDDEAAVREVAVMVLRRLNFNALVAANGSEGLLAVARHQKVLHAIVTDLHMPIMDGIAFVRAVRKTLPSFPIIVMSGRMDEQEKQECRKYGVSAILDKPFTEAQFTEALKAVLSPGRPVDMPL